MGMDRNVNELILDEGKAELSFGKPDKKKKKIYEW